MEQTQHDPQRMSTLYQYHNAPEVAPAHGLEYDDTKYSSSSDKYPVIHSRPFDPIPASKVPYNRNRPPRIIFGMKVRTFFIVAAVIVCILVGAAVGGAVGGRSMRENHAEKNVWPANGEDGNSTEASSPPSQTLSASPSVYSAPVPTHTPLSSCPDANNTEYTSAFAVGRDGSVPATAGLNFTKYCDVESPLSSLPDASTLSEVFVYSFDDCVEVCVSLNFWAGDRNCSVAVYDAKGNRPGNCWVGSVDGLEIGNLGEKDGMGMAVLRGD